MKRNIYKILFIFLLFIIICFCFSIKAYAHKPADLANFWNDYKNKELFETGESINEPYIKVTIEQETDSGVIRESISHKYEEDSKDYQFRFSETKKWDPTKDTIIYITFSQVCRMSRIGEEFDLSKSPRCYRFGKRADEDGYTLNETLDRMYGEDKSFCMIGELSGFQPYATKFWGIEPNFEYGILMDTLHIKGKSTRTVEENWIQYIYYTKEGPSVFEIDIFFYFEDSIEEHNPFVDALYYPGQYKSDGIDDHSSTKAEKMISSVLTVITNIGMVVAVIMVAVFGVKFMLASAEEKADYKSVLVPYFVGAALIFGILTFVDIFMKWGEKI